MVPDKFNMVDMGGVDLIMMQGEAVPGLYEKLMAAISNCRYQCLYNWLFDGVLIPPTYVQIEVDGGEVYLNEGVSVTSDNVIHIYSIEPPAPEPEIIPFLAEENGTYNAPAGIDGFNPVTVVVPSYVPIIESLSVTENGTYTVPAGKDGFNPVVVNVDSGPGRIYIVNKEELTLMKRSTKPGQNVNSISYNNYLPYRAISCFEQDNAGLYYNSSGNYIRISRGNNKVIQFFPKIPASCSKLYLEIAADASGQSYPISSLNLVDAVGITGYYSGQWSGATLKSYVLTNTTDPGNQPGLTLTRTSATVVPRQVAEIDLSGINADCYFTYFGCRSYFDIYDIYAE